MLKTKAARPAAHAAAAHRRIQLGRANFAQYLAHAGTILKVMKAGARQRAQERAGEEYLLNYSDRNQ
jgi:hypothetical protein